ncbi:MAG TPA: VOC family protein, partial [Gaiellaceae bacterium]|nr:VOC family protein [Gaiellaceae bacterium]
MPIDHVKIPCTDFDASRAFYSTALSPFGHKLVYDGESSLGFGIGAGGDDDKPFALELGEPPRVRTHIAITTDSTEQVDHFHAAALAAGGTDNGAPGERPYGAYYYAAFVLDPDISNALVITYRGSRGLSTRARASPTERADDEPVERTPSARAAGCGYESANARSRRRITLSSGMPYRYLAGRSIRVHDALDGTSAVWPNIETKPVALT